MFGILENWGIFAVFNAKEHFYLLQRFMDFFISIRQIVSNDIGCSYSHVGYVSLRYMVFFGENGKRTAFFLYITQISTTMPKNLKLENGRIICNPQSTPNSAKTVSYRKFEIEKNAKNEAYYFIISNGLLEEFMKFCKNYRSSDPHKDCLKVLLSNL